MLTFPGLLVLGGDNRDAWKSVEYWSPEVTCSLPSLRRVMDYSPSVNFLQDTIVVCYDDSCDKLEEGAWVKMADTRHTRRGHTSEVISGKILLIGGIDSPATTELVTVDDQSVEGFSLDPERINHCSLKISDKTVVLIGGYDTQSNSGTRGTESKVTEYSGIPVDVTSRELPDLLTGRFEHACGQYMAGETQVRGHWSLTQPSHYPTLSCTVLY